MPQSTGYGTTVTYTMRPERRPRLRFVLAPSMQGEWQLRELSFVLKYRISAHTIYEPSFRLRGACPYRMQVGSSRAGVIGTLGIGDWTLPVTAFTVYNDVLDVTNVLDADPRYLPGAVRRDLRSQRPRCHRAGSAGRVHR